MKTLSSIKHVLFLLPLWSLAAACWSLSDLKYSSKAFTILGSYIHGWFWGLGGAAPEVLGFIGSMFEIAAIAIFLGILRVSLRIYVITPLIFLLLFYRLSTFHGLHFEGGSFKQYCQGFGLLGCWSLYLTAWFSLIAFSVLHLLDRFRKN